MTDLRKTIAIADLHLTDEPRDEYRHEFVQDFASICRKRGAERIAILGDLTEQKDHHSARVVNRIVAYLYELAGIAPVWILMGNHDYLDEGFPFFAFVDKVRGVTWIDKPYLSAGEWWLPHTRDYKKDWDDSIVQHKDRVWAHNTFTGANVGFGRQLEGIPIGYLKSTSIIAGDIHVPQFLPVIKGKHQLGGVTYIGAPYTVDYGDDYEPRYLIVEGKKQTSMSLASFPQKRLIVASSIAEVRKELKTCNEGDVVKIRLECDDIGKWADTHAQALDIGAKLQLRVQRVEPIVQRKTQRRNKLVDTSQTDTELIDSFGKRHNLSDATIKEGHELADDNAQ